MRLRKKDESRYAGASDEKLFFFLCSIVLVCCPLFVVLCVVFDGLFLVNVSIYYGNYAKFVCRFDCQIFGLLQKGKNRSNFPNRQPSFL
jgi:hypothetical protein